MTICNCDDAFNYYYITFSGLISGKTRAGVIVVSTYPNMLLKLDKVLSSIKRNLISDGAKDKQINDISIDAISSISRLQRNALVKKRECYTDML